MPSTETASPASLRVQDLLELDQPAEHTGVALQGLIGIDSLKHSARLAGLAGGALLLLVAGIAWLGTARTGLDEYWLAWAAAPAFIAAFGGPFLGRQLLSRRFLSRWRFLLLLVMTVNSTAWAFASALAASLDPPSLAVSFMAILALTLSLLPMLAWLPGLIMQLAFQLLFTASVLLYPDPGHEAFLLPLGVWVALCVLALMASAYARRVEVAKADAHYMRVEASELQARLDESQERLGEADDQCEKLEAELAEILNLAESADRAKTEFLATMSHEIRTPLNGILPILEMLRDTQLDEEQRKLIRTAQGSSRHLLRIINDILDFAKVESGKLQLETIEIDVRDMVDSVSELMSGSARNHNLKLNSNIADNVPQVVRGDPIRLRQILINLVSNAIKFTESGGIRIEVSRAEISQKEVELLFAVADTGVGMSPETADRLFQSFSQADASTTRKHGGTGLGLVICKRLVELMGGKIGVRSALGKGSTFWFLVPLRKSVIEVPSARTNLNGVRILSLVTDKDHAARLSRYLQEWGVVEESTSDPLDAVTKLRTSSMLGETWSYELALIDGAGLETRLPGIISEIRSIESLRRLRIIAVVRSEAMAERLERDAGVVILTETIRPEPLRRILHRLFDVESRHFGNPEMRPEEIYDDLNVSAQEIEFDPAPVNASAPFSGRALLVEDNPVNLGVIKKALAKLGLSCQTAADGREAINEFAGGGFDIVFMDCQMPVMDGYESTRHIRRLEAMEKQDPTPIVAMTANAMAGDREKCLEAGMDDYLAKPVSVAQLSDCIATWIAPREKAAQPTQPPARAVSAETRASEEDRASAASPVLDAKVLRELRDIMEDDYVNLLQTYLDNAPQLVAEVQAALGRGDVSAMVIPVHSLKSSSANVGAMQLSSLARKAERLARAGSLGEAEAAFRDVEAAFHDADTALREHVRSACASA
ncbi:MAG: response regulator [Gammaproteobacteria bacterium]|nr:response regulator [Gammaproteobacteria bacterium]